jgi:hypothetical protein
MEQNTQNFDFRKYKVMETNLMIAKSDLRTKQRVYERLIASQGPQDVKAQDYTKSGKGSGDCEPIDRVYTKIIEARDAVVLQSGIVSVMEEQFEELKKAIEEQSKKFDSDLELKVFVLYHIKGNSLQNIGRMLHYSCARIKQISQDINRKIQ